MTSPLFLAVAVLFIWHGRSLAQEAAKSVVETYTFQNFPKDKVAMHFSCKESNMFATNCACHLRCTDAICSNGKKLCEKYSKDKGCKYMLIRGGKHNRIATLKRTPTADEESRFRLDKYPSTFKDMAQDPYWKDAEIAIKRNSTQPVSRAVFRELIKQLGPTGDQLLQRVFMKGNNASAPHCGQKYASSAPSTMSLSERRASQETFLSHSISLVALSYHSPLTLLNSMRTWQASGLLDLVAEKIIILNDPMPEEMAIALDFGFRIVQPRDMKPTSKMAKPNVWTIGAAFHYALRLISSEYLLFLENDFKMDVSSSRENTMLELLGGAAMLDSGAEIVRLNSRTYQGCGTFKSCDHHGIHLQATDPGARTRNWFAFYCRGWPNTQTSVSDCLDVPEYRCFSSWDTNWTLNAVLVRKKNMLHNKHKLNKNNNDEMQPTSSERYASLSEIALQHWQRQDGFESAMLGAVPWQQWRLPVCISYRGLFVHEEIETAA